MIDKRELGIKGTRDPNWIERHASTILWFIPFITAMVIAVILEPPHTFLESFVVVVPLSAISTLMFEYLLKKWYLKTNVFWVSKAAKQEANDYNNERLAELAAWRQEQG